MIRQLLFIAALLAPGLAYGGTATNFLIPNYIGDLLPADVTWWQTQAGASVTLYNSTGAATPPIL